MSNRSEGFDSLSAALTGSFEKPLADLPDSIRERVEREFAPFSWDLMTPERRKSHAEMWDFHRDPAKEQDLQHLWDQRLAARALEKQIAEWMALEARTPGDLALKETRLEELRQEQARMGRSVTENANPSADGLQTNAAKNPCSVFLEMKDLDAQELTITFVGDKSEAGMSANNMLEISARNETRRVALAALELLDRRRGSVNSQGTILLGMANKQRLVYSPINATKMMRLRAVFRVHLGISTDPFEDYRKGVGWEPRFKLRDKRGAADERAKREAERRTVSYEGLMERGDRFAGSDEPGQSGGGGNDEADTWLKNNDKSA